MRSGVVTGITIVVLTGAAAETRAQVGFTTSAEVLSGYHDRGLTLVDRPVLQPATTLSLARGATTLAVSAWSNVQQRVRMTELDVGIEVTHALDPLSLTAGVHEIRSPRGGALVRELLFSAALAARLSPSLTIIPDIADTGGAYVESAVAWTREGERPIVAQASLGSSWGQTDDGDVAFSYVRDGLTHAALTLSLPRTIGSLEITPRLSTVHGIDPAARALTLFTGVGVSWTR